MSSVIEFQHVWKQYQVGTLHHRLSDAIPNFLRRTMRQDGKFWALQDVSFGVQRSETLGIVGRNGAGKSTILKLLSGIMKPTTGTIDVKGRLAALIEVGAGFHPDLTGRENIFLNGAILGLRRHEIRALFDRIVSFAEVERFIDTPVKRYSSGMYVRLGFAIAVHVNPEVLLIDEVLSVGDLAFQQKCVERIHEMKQAGTTIVFISHNLNAVQRICDRAVLLDAGRIVGEGQVADVIAAYRERVVTKERQRFETALARQAEQGGAKRGVRIETVQVCNRDGQAAERFETGEPMRVEVAYACNRRVERPTVTISIDRVDGVVCHVASTQREGIWVVPLDGRGVLSLTYPELNLLPNAYRISVEISEEGRPVPLDSRKHGCFFSITSDHAEGGAVHLEHSWQWGQGRSA